MKNNVKVLGVLFFAAIYCFGIGVVSNTHRHSGLPENVKSAHEKFISDFTGKFFCHTVQSESSLSICNNLPTPDFRNAFEGLAAITRGLDQLVQTEFSQYNRFTGNTLVNSRKSDLIYPFHYFW